MTYDELGTLIGTLGLPVAMPGESAVALPAYHINPTGMQLVDGFDVLYNVCEVSVRVPLASGNPGQFDAALTHANELVGVTLGSQVQLDPQMPVNTSIDATPASINIVVTMVFPADELIRPV
jgi:hypothetical protein